jgi:membrane protein DedA with SNARE-associated domain
VQDFLVHFGPIAVFVATAVEGDLGLIVGGVAAHLGLVHPLVVVVLGALGGFCGDAVWFAIGWRSADAIRRSAAWRRVGPTVERLVARFGPRQILLARPVWGTRVATMLFWGTERLSPARFVALDLPACTVWAVLLVSLGYYSSASAEALLGKVRRAEEWLAVAVLVAVGAALCGHLLVRSRAASRIEQ